MPMDPHFKSLRQKILELEKISGELEPSQGVRNNYFQQIRDFANTFINDIELAKAFSGKKPDRKLFKVNGRKTPLEDLIRIYSDEVVRKGINAASGGHIGYVPGGGIFTSSLGDYLADITNEYAGLMYASPGAVIMENEVLNWMKSVFGFPSGSAGTLTSGGSIANMIALTAARDHYGIKAEMVSRSVIYLSRHTHHCIHKALKIIGLGEVIIRYSDLDEHFRINPEKLENCIDKDKADGLNPFLIVASAGTTDTGAIDPLQSIGGIARNHDLWYHIDAAYGGFFILTRQKKEMFSGIEQADSIVTDPHKGLFIPYGTGAVLVKNKESVFQSYRYTASYMQDSKGIETDLDDPADVSPELTRHFRALRVWLPLKIHGIEPFVACLEEKLHLTNYFRDRLRETGFKTGPPPDLSISYFWYPSGHIDEELFNKKLLERIRKDGRVFFSSTRIENRFVIRMAVLSFRTKLRTIDLAVEILDKTRRRLEKEIRQF